MNLWREGRDQFEQELRGRGVNEADVKAFLAEKATFQEAQKSCESIKQDADKKYSRLEVAGQKIPVKWISVVMSNMQRIIQVGDYMIKGAPETVALCWWAIKQVLGGIQNNYKLYGFFGTALANITDAMVLIATYDRLYDERNKVEWTASDIVQKLLKHVRSVYAAILDFSWAVRKHVKGGTWDRFKHAFKDLINADFNKFEDKMKTIESLKKKISEASGVAFQEKTFKQSDELQALVVNVQKVQEESIKESRETNAYLTELMTEIAQANRPPSRMDWAKRKYEENRKVLAPLDEDRIAPEFLIKSREQGTCGWIFEDEAYKTWQDSKQSSMLCLSGDSGTGKTFMAAAIFEKLDSATKRDKQPFVQYIDCYTARTSVVTSREVGGQEAKYSPGDKIQNTLISQICDLIARKSVDEDDAMLLEKCNDLFQHPKAKKSAGQKDQRAQDMIPAIAEAYEKFNSILDYEFYIILDSVEQLDDPQNNTFMTSLFELGQRKDRQFHILLSTRALGKLFTGTQRNSISQIFMESNNSVDIKQTAGSKLERMPGWTRAEKDLAQEKILEKAGPYFQYVIKVAIPFLEQPWQRPLTNHLNLLPGGLLEVYGQAIRQMEPNYFGLLKTALTWTLMANRDPTPTEICEAYSGVYTAEDCDTSGEEEISSGNGSELFYDQIMKAAGPFLEIWPQGDKHIVKLKDSVAIRKFCMQETPSDEKQQPNSDTLCAGCKTSVSRSRPLQISEKEGHLTMALTMMRHINSSKYLKRFLPSALTSTLAATSDQVVEMQETISIPEENRTELSAENREDEGPKDSSEAPEPESKPGNEDTAEASEAKVNGVEADKAEINGIEAAEASEDESLDSDDRSESEWTVPEGDSRDSEAVEEVKLNLRYELEFPFSHIRMAQALWTPEERKASDEWKELTTLLENFFIKSPEILDAWQKTVQGYTEQTKSTVIQSACLTALPEIVEIVLSQGADIDEVTESNNESPLHVAASINHGHALTRFLLDRGADPNRAADYCLSPFHKCLISNPDLTLIKEFFHHSGSRKPVSLTLPNFWGWTALHCLAYSRAEPAVLDLLLNNGADIDIRDTENMTPLHLLLDRREIPLELLRAFVDRGANVTAEDNASEMPLYKAAREGELDAIKIFIDKYTVEDMDDINIWGRTAMHNAAWYGHFEVVELLADRGASILTLDKHNRTPFFFACLGRSEKIALYLLDRYIEKGLSLEEINRPTKSGRTPFREAAAHGMLTVVERLHRLFSSQDTINVSDTRKRRTALHCAALRGRSAVVKFLLEKGANMNLSDGSEEKGLTALGLCSNQWAIKRTKDYEDTVVLLIDQKPHVAASDAQLLATATINNSRKVLEKLYAAGANLNKPDQYGWTPLILATRYQQAEVREYINKQLGLVGKRPSSFPANEPHIQVSEGGTILTLPKDGSTSASTIANYPAPAGLTQYYWEITVKSSKSEHPVVGIGFCNFNEFRKMRFPGLTIKRRGLHSWAHHGDDGGFYASAQQKQVAVGEPWNVGDTVGCGVDYNTNTIFFTRNGQKLDTHFDDAKGRLFPCVGFDDKDICVEVNFGNDLLEKPFVWLEGNKSHIMET